MSQAKTINYMDETEKSLYQKVSKANFPPGTAIKRFMKNDPDLLMLSDRGRKFLAFIAHRFRRQYFLTEEELQWISQWKDIECQ